MKYKNKHIGSYSEDTFKLLLIRNEFQKLITDLRQNIGIDNSGFKGEGEVFEVWYNALHTENGTYTRLMKLERAIEGILREYGLTEDFKDPLRDYIFFNTVKVFYVGSYVIGWEPKPKNYESLKVTLSIHRKLSTKDLNHIQNTLKTICNINLPEHRKVANKPIENIDERIKSFTTPRGIFVKEQFTSDYLTISKKEFDNGKITKRELENRIKLHKDKVIKIKHKSNSKTISKQVFKGKKTPVSVRKSDERLKKEIEKRFKKV